MPSSERPETRQPEGVQPVMGVLARSPFWPTLPRHVPPHYLTALWILLGPLFFPLLPQTTIVLDRSACVAPARVRRPRYLRVYTATRDVQSGRLPYQVHTPYWVFNDAGQQVRSVVNYVGDTDQAPMLVSLSSGRYRVLAEAAGYGRVTVPVVITAGMLTEVFLQRGGMPSWEGVPDAELVRLPEGPVAGFHARKASKPGR
jgi:hypothetical protein